MYPKNSEKGQALVLIVLAIVGLIGLTGLAIDGGSAYLDQRNAQNAADAAAFAGALANSRGNNVASAAQAVTASNSYDNNGATNTVTVTVTDAPSGSCPEDAPGKDVTVVIASQIDTYFAPVVGIRDLNNEVIAVARSCGTYTAPMFDGNAIVSLAPTGKGYDATGTPKWNITGGGIFSNSNAGNAAYCNGNAGVTAPSVTVVGGVSFSCHTVNVGGFSTSATQYVPTDYKSMFPPTPACDGVATKTGNTWYPQSGKDGSKVAFSGDMHFSSGLYCITNSPGPYHGQISGNGVTFYIMSANFNMKFNGGGNLTATAPTQGDYAGVLMYLAPQFSGNTLLNTQAIDLRGNGTADFVGTIIAPSADVTMFGNSGTKGFRSQIIAYQVDTGGNSNINISYNADDNYQPTQPITISLIR